MVVKRGARVLGVIGVLMAATLALAPVTCSESSEADGSSCKTVFGYASPLS
jgi:hypothetical protein